MGSRLRGLVLPLRTWLLGTHLVVLILPVVVLLGTGALGGDLRRQTADDIGHQAVLVALHVSETGLEDGVALSRMLSLAKGATLAGYRVVDAAGVVVATSGNVGQLGDNLRGDPDVRDALLGAGSRVWTEQRDTTRSRSMPISGPSRRASVRMFVAEPIIQDDVVIGAVVVSRTPREELQAVWHMAPQLSVGVALSLLLTVLLALNTGWVVSRSLRSLARASHRMAAGDLDAVADLAPAQGSRVREARDLAAAMGSMAARLRARLAYISEFASHVSHEFKTPVSSLRGTVELIRDDDEMPQAQRARFLGNALEDLDRLSRLVGGLLRLARAEEGGERGIVELDGLVREVVGRHPGVHVSGRAGLVDGSVDQLAAVVQNLLDNARRYGGDGAKVQVRLWAEEDRTGIEVEDDGPGISPANQGQVFDRFFTTGRAHGGTGLGLALVQAVAQAHGGAVTVRSRPGCTVFRLGLPALGR